MPNFKEYNQKQGQFIILMPDELLEEHHPARIVDKVVEGLNLDSMIAYYSDEGSETYHPRMMTKVLFYGYQQGIFTGRKLQAGLTVRADFIYLSGGQVPNFRTLNAFRARHLNILPELFTQVVMLCKKLGMIDFKYLAVDGQKIQANASFKKTVNKERFKKNYTRLKEGITKLLEKEIAEEFTEEIKDKRISRLEKQVEEYEEMRNILESFSKENESINFTDTEAKNMKHKDRRILPSYNHQSAVDGKYGVTVSVNTKDGEDKGDDLFKLVDDAFENTGEKHENVMADSRFGTYESLKKMENEREEEFYVPDGEFEKLKNGKTKRGDFDASNFQRDEEGVYRCPAGKKMRHKNRSDLGNGEYVNVYEGEECDECKVKNQCTKGKSRTIQVDSRDVYRKKMREKLQNEKGREIYMKRQGIIEPVHGNDQKNLGFKQHYLRGLKKASLEFLLIRIGSNLSKIIRFRAAEILALK